MVRLDKRTLNWQGMKWAYRDLRARMSIGSVGYSMIGGASS